MIDIHSIGAGGGSIAEIDAGGALRVGPRSAGSHPGPACYGLGGKEPSVTDANLVLGRILPEFFHAGRMQLDYKAASDSLTLLTKRSEFPSIPSLTPIELAALGVIQVVNANMLRALRVISIERGHDPRDFILVSFGGAGGLHACELAMAIGIRTVLIPKAASTLSALGMLIADVVKDYVQTVMLDTKTDYESIEKVFGSMVNQGMSDLVEEGFDKEAIELKRLLEVRYEGQSYELTVPMSPNYQAAFHSLHQDVYGYQFPNRSVEIVNLRLKAYGKVKPPPIDAVHALPADIKPLELKAKDVILVDPETGITRRIEVPFLQRESLLPGEEISGPAVLLQPDTTVLLPEQACAQVDGNENLLIEIFQ
jgi:N-methylhydantoinase A